MTQPSAGSRPELLRVLGLGFGLAVVIGGVVGQGILRTPGIVAGVTLDENLILMLWIAGGALAATTAFAIVELASCIPKAGGPYTFIARAFNPFAGTLIGWVDWLQGMVVVAYLSVVFAEYLQRLGFLTNVPTGAIALGLITVVTIINSAGARTCGMTQSVGTALKGLGLIVLIALLFLAPGTSDANASVSSPPLTIAAMAIAMRVIQNTYAGWNTVAYFCEDMRAPERNIVRSVFGGLGLVTVLYVLVNAAMLHVLTPEQMAGSKLPAADALGVALGETADVAANVLALVSLAAITNLYPMYLSRIGFAMARNGVLPSMLARVSTAGTPRVALVLTTLGAAVLASTGSYEQLIAMVAPLTMTIDISVNAAAIALRRREPALARPFTMPLYPLPAILGMVLNGLLLAAVIYEDPFHSMLGLMTVAVIGLIYKVQSVIQRGRALRMQEP
jgi:basic amino acid/polyamine antiporter, APA family